MRKYKVVDLFSGAGGMSYGFKSLQNFSIVGAVDFQKGKPGRGKSPGSSTGCNPTYQKNIGIAPLNQDIGTLSPSEYRRSLGLEKRELTVLISCAPCTGFSQKNANNHTLDDPRNRLVARTADFVAEFEPEFLVMENVKELLTGRQRHHFEALKTRLEGELGYTLWAEVHDLADFGLPQRRRRALIIARRRGDLVGLTPKSNRKLVTVREAIGHLPPLKPGECSSSDLMHVCPSNTPPVQKRIKAIPKDGGSWADVMFNPAISDQEKREILTPSMFRARPGSFPDVYGRLWWDRPSITITRECGHVGNGRYTHPEQDRLLSVREMAILQGFPASYHFEGPLTARYNQIGDAVPPLVSRLVAKHILGLIEDRIDVSNVRCKRMEQLSLGIRESKGMYITGSHHQVSVDGHACSVG